MAKLYVQAIPMTYIFILFVSLLLILSVFGCTTGWPDPRPSGQIPPL